jgi:hypothetical protein
VECIGLYAMAGASRPWLVTSAVQLLGPLLLADSCYTTKRAAVRALTDLALLLRPATVDAVLRGPRAAAAATTAAEDAADSSAAADGAAAADGLSAGLSRSLLELLLEQTEVLLAEAQAPAAKPKRGGRWAGFALNAVSYVCMFWMLQPCSMLAGSRAEGDA